MQYISSYNLTLFLFMYFELICSFKFIPFRKDTISLKAIERAPYDDVIPYFSEHVQKSDQILFLGLNIYAISHTFCTHKPNTIF